jgi:hypothetical protein
VLTNSQNLDIQLRACLEMYRLTDELCAERKTGYYYFDLENGWKWAETLPNSNFD